MKKLVGEVRKIVAEETRDNARNILANMPKDRAGLTVMAEAAAATSRALTAVMEELEPLARAQRIPLDVLVGLLLAGTDLAVDAMAAEIGACPNCHQQHAEDDESAGSVFPTGLFGTSADEGLN
jgi:hypothetical protein